MIKSLPYKQSQITQSSNDIKIVITKMKWENKQKNNRIFHLYKKVRQFLVQEQPLAQKSLMQTPLSQKSSIHRSPKPQQASSRSLHSDNLFSAYKTLKYQQDHLTNAKNRIHKLQQHQLKTLQKCQNQQKILLSLEHIRQQKSLQTQKLQHHKQMIRNSMEEQHNRINVEKEQHKKSIREVFTDIKNKRMSNYQFMKKKREENEVRLGKIRELDLGDRKKMRDRVLEEEKIMRQSKMVKSREKKENIQKNNNREIKELEEKSRQQGLEIQKLARLQMELLEKHSQSQVKKSQVKEKYQAFIKNQHEAVKELRKKQAVESVYVHPLVKRIQKRIDKYNIRNAR